MTKEFAGVPLSLISLDWQAACLYQQELFGLYLIVLSMHKLLVRYFNCFTYKLKKRVAQVQLSS